MIKRYYLDSGLDPCPSCVFTEDADGEWVRWEDVEVILGALGTRTCYRTCPECDSMIEDGFSHAESCVYYDIDEFASNMITRRDYG